jgi:hypothetical protein
MRRRTLLVVLVGLAVVIAGGVVVVWTWPEPFLRIVGSFGSADSAGSLRRIDPDQPFKIEVGRGSGLYGLSTVMITADGNMTVYRGGKGKDWETTTVQLPKESVAAVLAAVDNTGVLGLKHRYVRADIADGDQWVFWVQQGDNEKSVYCSNDFPKPVVRFAAMLDAILAENRIDNAQWRRVPVSEVRDHEKALWHSIRYSP